MTKSAVCIGVLWLSSLVACGGVAEDATVVEHEAALAEARRPPPETCNTYKIEFTRETGCLNDGSVEFCVPPDPDLWRRLRKLVPSAYPASGAGRARCVEETRFVYPTRGTDRTVCVSYHGAMTKMAWFDMCIIAAFPEIRRIVPTWYE